MEETERLIFISEKSQEILDELWKNCFEGEENNRHMNAFVPFPVTQQQQLDEFINYEGKFKSWIIKRKKENDAIGFVIHGHFFPGHNNDIGFNIGLKYTKKGYATETLNALLKYLKEKGYTETYGHCYQNNIASIKTMEKCGFINSGKTGKIYNGNYELKFKKTL